MDGFFCAKSPLSDAESFQPVSLLHLLSTNESCFCARMSGGEAASSAAVTCILIASLQPTSLKHKVESKSEGGKKKKNQD